MALRYSYEIHVLRENRWVLDSTLDDEARAKDFANRIISAKGIEGVKIIREHKTPSGEFVEKMIFEKMKKVDNKKDISISEIQTAANCEDNTDLYKLDSRVTIGRILRKYLDESGLTPTELLHNYRELKRLLDMDITHGAVDRVASLQVRQTGGGDTRKRRDELYGFLEKASSRAQAAQKAGSLPSVKQVGFGAALQTIDSKSPPEERDFLALTALSTLLLDTRNWTGKLLELVAQMERSSGARPLGLLDCVVADVLAGRSVIQDLVGPQPSLAVFLARLADLIEGHLDVEKRDEGDAVISLNKRFAEGQLEEARSVLMEYALRQVKGPQPLIRNDPNAEFELFRQLLNRFITSDGIFGGSSFAEAMVLRYVRFLPHGGAPARREAISVVANLLPSSLQRVIFMLSLLGTEIGTEQAEHIVGDVQALVGNATRIDDLVPAKSSPKVKMQEITGMYRLLLQSSLQEELREELASALDQMLADFLLTQQIVEKLDRPEDSMRLRALRLVQFCASGVLTDGKAFEVARNAVLTHLRQPNFEAAFVADISDAAQRERAIRDFHALLNSSNFFREKPSR